MDSKLLNHEGACNKTISMVFQTNLMKIKLFSQVQKRKKITLLTVCLLQ